MTLADFLKVFDFEHGKVEIFTYSGVETYAGTYISKNALERDFFTMVYNVMSIRPVTDSMIQVVIFH